MTLTARAIEAAKPMPGKRVALPDGKVPGLELIVQETGAKSWALRAYLHGHRLRLTLGRYPAVSLADARALATARLKLIAQGIDPRDDEKQRARAAQERKASTFEAVAADFLALHAKVRTRPRSWRETERLLRQYALPAWHDWPIADVQRRHVAKLIDGLGDKPPTQRAVLAAVRKLFNWAIEREIIATNPAAGIKAARVNVRERVLSDEEIRAVWRACEAIGYPAGPFARLLLLTGCRRAELATARWDDIDREQAVLVIPGDRYKTGRPHAVPLAPLAMEILDRLPVMGGHFLFTTTGDKPISGFSKMLARLIQRSGVDFSLHDLRRTTRTGLARLGVEHSVAERVLGHVQQGVGRHYDHHGYLPQTRHALTLWAQHVQGLLDGAPAENVVALRR